jgi:hypothetical protein
MFCYGYIGQILASRQGHIAQMSEIELNGCLQHLFYLLELTTTFSSNADYSASGVNICPKTGKPFPNGKFQNHKLFPENGA